MHWHYATYTDCGKARKRLNSHKVGEDERTLLSHLKNDQAERPFSEAWRSEFNVWKVNFIYLSLVHYYYDRKI